MSLTNDLIRERIADDVEAVDLNLACGLIEDAIPPGAGLDTIASAITKAKEAYSPLFRSRRATRSVPITPADPTITTAPASETVTARVAREHRESIAQRDRQAASGDFNPWAKGSISVTQQVLITSRDPARAARLRAEAGVR